MTCLVALVNVLDAPCLRLVYDDLDLVHLPTRKRLGCWRSNIEVESSHRFALLFFFLSRSAKVGDGISSFDVTGNELHQQQRRTDVGKISD